MSIPAMAAEDPSTFLPGDSSPAQGPQYMMGEGTPDTARQKVIVDQVNPRIEFTNTIEVDEYTRKTQLFNMVFKNVEKNHIDQILANTTPQEELNVTLRCDGAPGGSGGWEVSSITGTCFGQTVDASNPGLLKIEPYTQCTGNAIQGPNGKQYCVWESSSISGGLPGQSASQEDDMFKIYSTGDQNGFLEYMNFPQLDDSHRLRWIRRNQDNGQTLMIPGGPVQTFADYSGFMDQFEGANSSALVTVEKACFPVKVTVCDNRPPEVVNHTFTMEEETQLTGNLLTGASDPNQNDTIAINTDRLPTSAHGQISIKKDGSLTFTPKNNYFGQETLTYVVSDDHGLSTEGTFTITVTDRDEIQAKSDTTTITEGGSIKNFSLLRNDSNPYTYPVFVESVVARVDGINVQADGNRRTITTQHGKLTLNSNSTVTYTPDSDFYGKETFTYTSNDRKGTTDTETFTVTVRPALKVVEDAFTVVEADASVQSGASYVNRHMKGASLYQDTGTDQGGFVFKLDVLENDSGQGLRIDTIKTLTTLPNKHKLKIDSGKTFLTYQAEQDGSLHTDDLVRFEYTVRDAYNMTKSAVVTVDIVDMNSPLVLDLDGDGIEALDGENSNAYFDLDLDGTAEKTGGWISGDDAFLAIDLNGDGVINDRSELFGNTDVYAHGFESLASYDSNSDGAIDMGDDVYGNLLLWQDKDGDGHSGSAELMSLADASVASINLGAAFVNTFIENQWESHRSTFTYDDGTEGQISDIWFETD